MDKPEATPHKPHLRFDRRNAAIGVLVLAILLSAGIWWMAHKDDVKPQSEKNKPSQIINNALNTRDGATKTQLEAALTNNPTRQEKIQLLQLLATEAQKKNDFQGAVKSMEEAYDLGMKDPNLTMNIGILYLEKLQNKPQALKYFKIALADVQGNKSETALADNLTKFLTQKIKELEDQGVKAAR